MEIIALTQATTNVTPITTYKPTLQVTDTHVIGTVRELVSADFSCNGYTLDKSMLSVLIHLGLAEDVGTAEKVAGVSGIAPKIYKIALEQEAVFGIADLGLVL